MSKSFHSILLVFLGCSLMFVSSTDFKSVSGLLSNPPLMFVFLFEMVACKDKIMLMFFLMVSLVTSLVLIYSEYYLDSYNSKKFLAITISFLVFMMILSSAGDLMTLMVGWDGLGISSLFLIMFYPNKTSIFNSMVTFFFNRFSDIFLILFFCLTSQNFSLNLFFSETMISNLIFFVLFLCLLTKSAQFPLSSWLPAAMSAPTPISAMVHSSTLVTAGILVFFKTLMYLNNTSIWFILLLISCATFLMGGFMGCVEKDLKKMVAFSTMSQISMILFFLSIYFDNLAMSHTLGHALFKTLLFCSCGVLFTWNYSDQLSKVFKSFKGTMNINFLFIISIFSMSGLIFSSSFMTKDMVLEKFMEDKEAFMFFILVLGSGLTLIYSANIFKSADSTVKMYSTLFAKKLHTFKVIILFSIPTVICLKVAKELTLNNFSSFLPWVFVMFLNILILMIFFNLILSLNSFSVLNLVSNTFFMKDISFTTGSLGASSKFMGSFVSDHLFFKPSSLLNRKLITINFYSVKKMIYSLVLILISIML